MKNIVGYLLVLLPIFSFSQSDNISGIPIPMKGSKVFYEKEYTVAAATKDQLYTRAAKWFSDSFKDLKEPLLINDKDAGKLSGHGIFKVVVSESGNYFWMKPAITITVTDGKYSFQAYDYYEKPIEKGVSNEYSKIEYRWRDFRKGKPWSVEDKPLFQGIDENTLALIASLEKAMNQR